MKGAGEQHFFNRIEFIKSEKNQYLREINQRGHCCKTYKQLNKLCTPAYSVDIGKHV